MLTKLCRLDLGGPVIMPHRVQYLCINTLFVIAVTFIELTTCHLKTNRFPLLSVISKLKIWPVYLYITNSAMDVHCCLCHG